MDTVHIKDQANLKKKIHAMQSGGANKLHILADFDRTLTKGFYQGESVSSIISVLYTQGYLSDAYQKQAQELFDYYHAIETDPTLESNLKKKFMEEWWDAHLSLLIEHKISRKDIEKAVQHPRIQLRDQTQEFLILLQKHNIPLIIMSASGIGYDAITIFLQEKGIDIPLIDIISNRFIRDEDGYAIGRQEPVIHSLNKSETTLTQYPKIYNKVHERTNVILLGDSLHDLEMIDGFDYENLLTIGRCHSDDPEIKKHYDERFDIVITDDGGLDVVNDIIKQTIS